MLKPNLNRFVLMVLVLNVLNSHQRQTNIYKIKKPLRFKQSGLNFISNDFTFYYSLYQYRPSALLDQFQQISHLLKHQMNRSDMPKPNLL